MVAMGTSLSDKAWGRDSAVYRINGVMTVIAGWFFTAFIAFTIAGLFAVIIYYGETFAIIGLSLLALYLVSKTHKLHKLKSLEDASDDHMEMEPVTTIITTIEKLNLRYKKFFGLVDKTLSATFESFVKFDRSSLKQNIETMKKVKKRGNKIVTDIIFVVKNLPENELKKGRRYGRMMGATQEIAYLIRDISEKLFDHIDNNHRPFKKEWNDNILSVANTLSLQIQSAIKYFEDPSTFEDIADSTERVNVLLQALDEKQVEMLRAEGENFSARSNSLYVDILSFADNFSGQLFHLISVINKNYISLQKDGQKVEEGE
jgi:Na+/phosphate symporter